LFIGADPNAGWLAKRVAVDNKGFVITGTRFAPTDFLIGARAAAVGNERRGCVRDRRRARGSTKRVGAAIGEGAPSSRRSMRRWRRISRGRARPAERRRRRSKTASLD
jgi:hypothetical protein